MSEELKNILFNPNHEMPIEAIIGIAVICILFNLLLPRIRVWRMNRKDKKNKKDKKD